MEPPEFTSKALTVMAAAALIAMACVLGLTNAPAPDDAEGGPPQASQEQPLFKLLQERYAPGNNEPLPRNDSAAKQ